MIRSCLLRLVALVVVGMPVLMAVAWLSNRLEDRTPVILTIRFVSGTPAPLHSSSLSSSVRHVVTPIASPTDYVAMASLDAQDAGLSPVTFVRQIRQESGFNPNAVSSAGAIGIAQFMPETARGLGFDPHDPVASLKAAARLMKRYVLKYGSYACALAAYNAGPAALQTALNEGGKNWQAFLPDETRRYIAAILG